MPVNLSIKEVPDALAARLRARAERNHRSLQRELMTIIEAAAEDPAATAVTARAPAAPSFAMSRPPVTTEAEAGTDGLLDELDAIVADSHWGQAEILTRDQANDRRLQRELDFDARRAQAGGSPSNAP